MGKDKRDRLIIALVVVVILLLGFVAYLFLIKPAVSGYLVKVYNQGQVDAITAVLTEVQKSGYVQIPVGENQSVVLVPYQQSQTATQ